jgi:hypothetical protein
MWINRIVATGLQTTQNELHRHPLHSAKVTVCCAVSSHSIILEECGQAYSNCECRAVQSCWKHLCTMSYILISKICCGYTKMHKLFTQHKFPCKSSGQCFWDITWPTHLPDLSVPDYFLWVYVKSKVYETYPANTDDLKQQLLECIQGIPKEMLQCVMTACPLRLQECNEWHGGHLQSVIFKQ